MANSEKKRKHKHSDDKEHKHKKSKKSSKIVHVKEGKNKGSAFTELKVKLYVHLAPMWSEKIMDGVNETLNAFLMK